MKKIKLEVRDKALRPIKRKRAFILSPKKIVLIVFVVFLLLVVLYFWKQINFLIKAPYLEVSQPFVDITVTEQVFEIIGKTNSSAYLTINGQEVYINKGGNFKTEIELSKGINIVKIESKNRFDKVNEIIRRIIYE